MMQNLLIAMEIIPMNKENHSTPSRRQKKAAQRRRSRIWNGLLIAGGIFLLAGIFFSFARADNNLSVCPPQIGQPMSDLVLTDLNGKQVKLSDYKGKPVLINAWATWCPPCRAELPFINSYYQAYQAEGFTVLAINAGESKGAVSSFIEQQGYSFPVFVDPNTTVLDRLEIRSFPTSILVGRDGIVKGIHIGMFVDEASLNAEVGPLLAQ